MIVYDMCRCLAKASSAVVEEKASELMELLGRAMAMARAPKTPATSPQRIAVLENMSWALFNFVYQNRDRQRLFDERSLHGVVTDLLKNAAQLDAPAAVTVQCNAITQLAQVGPLLFPFSFSFTFSSYL